MENVTVNELYLWFKNTEKLWSMAEHCAGSLAKKMNKGLVPDLTYLSNSSTVKKIVRETHCDYNSRFGDFPLSTPDRRALHKIVAEEIIEFANELIETSKN